MAMVETKAGSFKTKLCFLYERGRCGRQTCNFAHGDAELRRHSADRHHDLRHKLDSKRSPRSRVSTRRFSPPPPPKRRIYRSYEHTDGTPDCIKDETFVLSESRNMVEDEGKQVKYEVDVLLDHKSHLKIELEERVQETDSLSSRIRDLEVQLSEEKVKLKSLNSKIRLLVRAHGHHSRLQDKIKRSQLHLEQLAEELGVDATQIDTSEDHMNINIISDEEVREFKDHACPRERPLPCSLEVSRGPNSGNLHLPVVSPVNNVRGHGTGDETVGRNSFLCLDGNRVVVETGDKREATARPSSESKPRCRKDASKKYGSSDALGYLVAPPTGIAAHAIDDDFVELETNESREADETVNTQIGLPFPLPVLPPLKENAYFQCEGDDEYVNVDGLDMSR